MMFITLQKAFFLFLIFFALQSRGQVAFVDVSANLINPNFRTWLQKGVADMNADGRDDMVRADLLGNFYILKQQADGSFVDFHLNDILK